MENLPPIDSDADMVVVSTEGDAAAIVAAEGTGESKTASDAYGPLPETDSTVGPAKDRRDDSGSLEPLPKYRDLGKHVSDEHIRNVIIQMLADPSKDCPLEIFAYELAYACRPDTTYKVPPVKHIEAILNQICPPPNWELECRVVSTSGKMFILSPLEY